MDLSAFASKDKAASARDWLNRLLSGPCSMSDISNFLSQILDDSLGLVQNRSLITDFIELFHKSNYNDKLNVWQNVLGI
jgi:hypothetical protein